MNSKKLILAAAMAALMFTACDKVETENKEPETSVPEEYQLAILSFEDKDYKGFEYTLNYCQTKISTWSDLISEVQNADQEINPLLYKGNDTESYNWFDKGNTYIKHIAQPQYWSGGPAISNYFSSDIENAGPNVQLTVYAPKEAKAGGHDGSKNFCVHYGYNSPYSKAPFITFGDETPRVIDHMWVNNTTYTLNALSYDNSWSKKFTDGDFLKIVAIGYNADNETGKAEFKLAEGTKFVKEWTKWDLSGLGEVTKVVFDVQGSRTSEQSGLESPGYFAYDDVAVRVK